MDLIGALVSQVGVDSNQAQALAGGVLGAVKSALADKAGPEAASQLEGAVPELGQWQAKASELVGGGGGLGGLLGGSGGSGGLGGALGALG
ncbi:hypothetical protein L6R52_40090, partial [Myxococcota bacterium]|nr:hypothetical protein [Myxococcota bacterium]